MSVLGIIPARGGSKGIPNKNKALFCGKPLIAYTLESATRSNLDHVIVSSDDAEILAIAKDYGIDTLQRPAELAQDDTPTLPVLQHVVKNTATPCEAIMTLQPTSPLRTEHHINDAIKLFNTHPNADSLVSIVKVPHNMVPSSLMQRDGEFVTALEATSATRRQDKPELWARNGAAIYISSAQLLQTSILGDRIIGYEMPYLDSIDIDTHDDFLLAELLYQHRTR
jgi:CMP-N-acetylneuraminic acid synthetase